MGGSAGGGYCFAGSATNSIQFNDLTPPGSLVFYLMNRAGEEARDAFLGYVRQHYKGVSGPDPSMSFGFADNKDLHAKFAAFLKSLRE